MVNKIRDLLRENYGINAVDVQEISGGWLNRKKKY